MSSRDSLTSWGEGVFLALVGYPSSDSVTTKITYVVDGTSTSLASHVFLLEWLKRNLILLLDQLRLA